jgi:hypothetical protein
LDEAFKAMIPSMIAEKTISCITSVADFISLLRPDDSAGAPSYSLEPEVGRSDGVVPVPAAFTCRSGLRTSPPNGQDPSRGISAMHAAISVWRLQPSLAAMDLIWFRTVPIPVRRLCANSATLDPAASCRAMSASALLN